MSTKTEVLDRIRELVAEQLGIDEAEIEEGSSFIDDLGADSLDMVELIMSIEEEFEVEIPEEVAEEISTIGLAAEKILEEQGSVK